MRFAEYDVSSVFTTREVPSAPFIQGLALTWLFIRPMGARGKTGTPNFGGLVLVSIEADFASKYLFGLSQFLTF